MKRMITRALLPLMRRAKLDSSDYENRCSKGAYA
jgi:hypothetical protein